MGIKSELHEAILKRGGKVPPYGGIAAAMDELNKLPGGGGDCDWNKMKNRPFGTETGMVEVLGETTLELVSGADGSTGFSLTERVDLVDGKSYVVQWNGTDYKSTAVLSETGAFYMGNLSVLGEDMENTGEPFVMMVFPAGSEVDYMTQILPLYVYTTATL